MYLNFIKKI